MRTVWACLAGMVLTLAANPAQADVAGRYENADENAFFDMEMTIEANEGGGVRMQMARQPSYYLLFDGELYAVTRDLNQTTVARVADIMTVSLEAMRNLGVKDEILQTGDDAQSTRFVAMGEEAVGEWTGTAYGMSDDDEGTRPLRSQFVISQDPRLLPLGQALGLVQRVSTRGMGRIEQVLGQMSAELAALMDNGAPVKMMQLVLTDVSFDPIDPRRFALPAEPLTLEQLRAGIEPFPPPPTLPQREEWRPPS